MQVDATASVGEDTLKINTVVGGGVNADKAAILAQTPLQRIGPAHEGQHFPGGKLNHEVLFSSENSDGRKFRTVLGMFCSC